MTTNLEELEVLLERATPGPWTLWAEKCATRDDATIELGFQVAETDEFVGQLFMLNAAGKCPAITGCGPTSEANATLIVAMRNALPTLLSERTAMQARIAELVEGLRTTLISLEWWQRNEPDSFGNIERNALDLAKSLLTPLVEKG